MEITKPSTATGLERPRGSLRSSLASYVRVALYPLLVLAFSLFAISPILSEGYWWGAHDARHSVYFLFEFNQAIRDGVLWPRWSPDFAFGYGYPFFNIYGPLSNYVGEAFHLLGFDLVWSVKLAFASSILLSGLAMYGFVHRLFGPNAALIAAVAYLYLPYHLADVYVRAALAESWAFVFFPLVFWGFYECVTAPRPRAIALTAVAYALFFLTHPGLVMQATFVLIAWVAMWLLIPLREAGHWVWQEHRALLAWLRRAMAAAGAGVLGVTLGGIFIFPWLLESQFVNTEQWFAGYFNYRRHFVALWQLLSPYWGFGTSVEGVGDTFPFQLGLVLLLFGVAAWLLPIREQHARLSRLFFTGMLLWFLFLMLEPSRFLWSSPFGELVLKPMQFPWRFLILAGFALSMLAGMVGRRTTMPVALLLCLTLVAGSYSYVHAEYIEPAEGPVSFAGLMRFQQSAGEMTGQSACVKREDIPTWSPLADVWVSGGEVNSRFDYGALAASAWAGNAQQRTTQEIIEVRLEEPQTVRWYITHYPGWHVYRLPLESDEVIEELTITPAPRTCHITVEAPSGHYRLLARFEDTPARVAGQWATVLSMLVVGALLVVERGAGSGERGAGSGERGADGGRIKDEG
ncbi:MAG: hypothetical protein M3220_14705 [Chloroflexota bacterium]|nr:hypothetical protein [Chloroflexota bacterium]